MSEASSRVHRVTTLAMLAAYATALHLLEAPLPRILPWAKPGLANSAALLTLLLYGLREALLVSAVRVVLSGLLLGHLLTPGWWMGAAGAMGAPVVMAWTLRACPPLGLISVSAAGAVASNALQLAVASALLVEHAALLASLPLLVTTALPAGMVVALLTHGAATRLPPGRFRSASRP